MAAFLLFLQLIFILGSGINRFRTSIDPSVGGQEENNNSPSGGELQREENTLIPPGRSPTELSGVTSVPAGTAEAPMLGNFGTSCNIDDDSSSNITIDDNSISNTGNNYEQATPPLGEEPDLATAMDSTESEPATTELVIGTWNIQSGRNTRLETALRALGKVGVDLCFLTETKLTEGIYTRFSSDYRVLATNAISHHQGGIALVYRDSPYWQVESSVFHGPNVMSAMIVSGNSRYGIVGAYIPPTDTTTSIHIAAALGRFSRRRKVILVGDLNLNLNSIESARDMEIAKVLADAGLLDMHHHFKLIGRFGKGNRFGITNARGK